VNAPVASPTPTYSESLVLTHLLAGESMAEIADALALSPHTVKHHLHRLRRVYGVCSTTELCCRAWADRYREAVARVEALEATMADLRRDLAALDRRRPRGEEAP
jgi:Bacterial regulatory proteins, luxR family